jgi:hypothetical protein
MLRIRCIRLFLMAVLSLAAYDLSAATGGTTYVVGTCRPGLPSFTTIAAALAAAAPGYVVMVCPGTYNEQLQVTKSVTLEGVSTGNASQVIIAPPSVGLVGNATDSYANSIAAQLWVTNAGLVNISNLTFDAAGNQLTIFPPYIAGIFFQDTSGTVNRVMTRNQKGNTAGRGIMVEGGIANPSITIENSTIHDFDYVGIVAVADAESSPYTAVIKNNDVDGGGKLNSGIIIGYGGTVTVQNNVVTGTSRGMGAVGGVTGTISNNVLTDNVAGIVTGADAVAVSANKILGSSYEAIILTTSAATIESNTIMSTPVGIDYSCSTNGNVRSNTIIDAVTGLANVPSAVATTNSYFSVGTIRGTGC